MWSLLMTEDEEASSMMEKDPTNNRTTYRTKGLELKREDSNLENLNISYVEWGKDVFILNIHLCLTYNILGLKNAVKMVISKSP